MPSVLSKILMPEWNVPYNCYELGHTWTPFCTEAALEIGLIVFSQSLKLYAPLYLVNQVFQRKFDRKSLEDCCRSIVRSASFLGINAFLVILFFCLSRQVLGRFYYTLCAYLPSFFGSLLAIFTERPSRRRALAFYVANIGSETLYRILVSRGYITPVKNGQYLLFATAITSLIFLYESGQLQDPLIKIVFQFLVGRSKERVIKQSISNEQIQVQQLQIDYDVPNDETNGKSNFWRRFLAWSDQKWFLAKYRVPALNYRHPLCSHSSERSCLENLLFSSMLKPFALGWLSQLAWRTVPKLLSGRFHSVREQLFDPRQLFSRQNMSFAIFLSGFTTVYSSIRCLLCHTTNSNRELHSIMASLVASPAMLMSPNTSMTLYLVWKCVEAFFTLGTKKGYIPFQQFLVPLIYALATSQLFYSAVLEPKHIKPSYKRFLDRVTQNRLKFINRNVLEVFGTKASVGYESFLPVYDLSHTTRRFQESVLVWLL